jgi:hypothetical protein
MIGLLCFVLAVLAAPIKSKMRLEAENAVLRHQVTVLRRRLQGRVRLTNTDRWVLIVLYRCKRNEREVGHRQCGHTHQSPLTAKLTKRSEASLN